MTPAVTTESASVYRVLGRRFLSKRSAYRRLALFAAHREYHCECEEETGFYCGAHGDEYEAKKERVVARLARWLMWRDRRRAQEPALAQSANDLSARRQYAALIGGTPSRWHAVHSPIFGTVYDFFDTETGRYGQCWMKQDGSGWGQAPLGTNPVILKWKGPT